MEHMSDAKVCPILSVRSPETACVEEDCAFWLNGPRKCAVLLLGYRAMMEMQQLQKGGQ